jgi:hypothetical protein
MNHIKPSLKPIIEENNDLCIELTYFSDTLPAIKSYYIMSSSEYEDLNSLHMDIYIENFINGETLTKDKLDIYLINKLSNVSICKNFIEQYGNPFDILTLINAKKKTKNIETTNIKIKNDLLTTEFSDSDTTFEYNNSESESDSIEYSERIIKLNKNKIINDDKCINTLTEIIDTYNKSNILDQNKLEHIKTNRPELLKDEVLNDIISNNN